MRRVRVGKIVRDHSAAQHADVHFAVHNIKRFTKTVACKHFRPLDYRDVQPVKHFDYLSTADNNGNNVDLEQEGMLALQNQMDYDLMVSVVRSKFNQVNSVLR